MIKKLCILVLALLAVCFLGRFLAQARTYEIKPIYPTYKVGDFVSSSTLETYAYENGVKNWGLIKRLISCESQWVNVSRPDSNKRVSRGLLQYNDGGTWGDFSKKSGIIGSPEDPYKAVLVADWAIEHGYLGRWSCSRILHLRK